MPNIIDTKVVNITKGELVNLIKKKLNLEEVLEDHSLPTVEIRGEDSVTEDVIGISISWKSIQEYKLEDLDDSQG